MNWLKACLSRAIEWLEALQWKTEEWLEALQWKTKDWIVERKATLIVIGIVLVPFILWKVPEWQVRAYQKRLDANAISKLDPKDIIQLQKDLITAENNARVTLAQVIGGLVVLLGLYATFKNVKIAQDNHKVALDNLRVTEEGKLTERFSKAVELLGSDKLDVRLGGIYALERIARDSQKDHWTVMEVLTAFVREQSRAEYEKKEPKATNDQEDEDISSDESKVRLREDIQVALTVIGRRKWVEQEQPGQVVDLNNSFLKRANLSDAPLIGANLKEANLSEADLMGANLSWAFLSKSNLSWASLICVNLYKAYLRKADLSWARLASANLSKADLSEANLSEADLSEANLGGADLRDVMELTWQQISKARIDETTKLPRELEERRKAEHAKKAAAPNQ